MKSHMSGLGAIRELINERGQGSKSLCKNRRVLLQERTDLRVRAHGQGYIRVSITPNWLATESETTDIASSCWLPDVELLGIEATATRTTCLFKVSIRAVHISRVTLKDAIISVLIIPTFKARSERNLCSAISNPAQTPRVERTSPWGTPKSVAQTARLAESDWTYA
eukprot:2301005-Amphidinium_carterae.1